MVDWTERYSGDLHKRPKDLRDAYQRDRARILHSAAFRRLQAKTQIMGVGQNDFYRTRLTHSLEVAQIGTGLTAQLKQTEVVKNSKQLQALIPSDALIESLCLAHDLGHPPFGHGGEIALNYMMRDSGGFEANGQTFRIITKLEPYTADFGMDLTRRSILGLVKYPIFIQPGKANHTSQTELTSHILTAKDWKPVKGLFLDDVDTFNWLLSPLNESEVKLFCQSETVKGINSAFLPTKSKYKSFDASVMEIADDIAYGVHDFEDAIALNKIAKTDWQEQVLPNLKQINNPWTQKHADHLTEMLFSTEHHARKNAIGALVNHLITNIEVQHTHDGFKQPIFQYNAQLNEMAKPILDNLKHFVFEHVINSTELQQLEFRGQRMLLMMFEAFATDPERLLPKSVYALWQQAHQNKLNTHRIICDYLASMSDEQATRSFHNLFNNHI